MRAIISMSILMACHTPFVRHCDDCGGGMQPTPAMPKISGNDLDVRLDIDQPRERKPGGALTEQQYVGPKQYDRLFVDIKHDVPTAFDAPQTGPLGEIDHVEVLTDATKLTTITRSDATAFQYKAEPFADVAYDSGATSGTREHLKLMLGPAVGDYVKSTHPFKLVVRGLSAAGALVIETSFAGDEAGELPAIVPPRS
jgi:hypothetical protein